MVEPLRSSCTSSSHSAFDLQIMSPCLLESPAGDPSGASSLGCVPGATGVERGTRWGGRQMDLLTSTLFQRSRNLLFVMMLVLPSKVALSALPILAPRTYASTMKLRTRVVAWLSEMSVRSSWKLFNSSLRDSSPTIRRFCRRLRN